MLHVGTVNEKLNVTKNKKTAETLKDKIEMALIDLEEAIIGRLGSGSQIRNIDLGLTVEEETNYIYGKQVYKISSNNLVDLTGPIGKTIYKEFIFETNGGTVQQTDDSNRVWFNPKFSFTYKNGGSNGTDAFWVSFWYDIDENKWIFGREI